MLPPKMTELTRLLNKLLPQKMAQEKPDVITRMEEMNELNHNLANCKPKLAKEMTKLTRLPKVHLFTYYSPSL